MRMRAAHWRPFHTMVNCLAQLCVVLVVSGAAFGAEPLPLESTGLFFEFRGELRQAVLANTRAASNEQVVVTLQDKVAEYLAGDLPRFMDRMVVPVSPPVKPATIRVELKSSGVQGRLELKPERRWEVCIVPHTHLDIGFTDLQEKVWEQLAKDQDAVIDLCDKTADWPEGSPFRWTIEATSLFENFARRYPKERVDRLVRLIHSGQVELAAFWTNELTELCGAESLLRAMYSSHRLCHAHDLRVDSVMVNDIPGYTWSLPQIWSQAGIRYANLRANGIRGKFIWDRPGAVPRPFWWESPDGSRVLCWYTDSYREANFLRADHPAGTNTGGVQWPRSLYDQLWGHLRRAESAGYDRDVIQLRMGGDNLPPTESVCRWVRQWNAQWAYPRLRLTTSREFFLTLLSDSRPLPVCRGDIPDWWADGAASSAKETGDARVAHEQAVALELFTSLPDGPMRQDVSSSMTDIFNSLLLYYEHTWGASSEKYAKDPAQLEGQWAVKRGYTEKAVHSLAEVERQWLNAVADWARPARDSVIVWNACSWPRTDLVRVPASQLPPVFSLRDTNGRIVEAQKEEPDQWCFLAHDVPALGYALLEIVRDRASAAAPGETCYDVTFDESQGVVRQIRHRCTGRDLIDEDSEYGFNRYLYERGGKQARIMPATLKEPRSPANKQIEASAPAQLVQRIRGPVFDRLITRTSGPNAPSIEQIYTSYVALDRVDILNRVEKTATEDSEGVYFAFPFDVPSPACRLEIPFTSMKPGVDQLKYSAVDFYSVYRWVEFSSPPGGVLWATMEAPVVTLSELRPECWHDDMVLGRPHLFSYVMNNFWFTNYRPWQGGLLTFRYAIQATDGRPDRTRAYRFGHEVCQPLHAQVLRGQGGSMPPTRTWFSVEPDHVAVTALKNAADGRGLIIRLLELGVADAAARVVLPPGDWAAQETDPTERDWREVRIQVSGGKPVLPVALRKNQLATIRLRTEHAGDRE